MSLITLANCTFCYILSLLGIAYGPGAAGFCLVFFGIEVESSFDDTYCLIDSAIIFFASILLLVGAHKEKRNFVIAYIVLTVIGELFYWISIIYKLATSKMIMHYEFIMPSMIWQLFQLFGLYYAVKCYQESEK